MKKIIILPLWMVLFFVGCDVQSPINTDQYPQKVYIVGAKEVIVNRDVNIDNELDTISISVAVSGSLPTTKDVTVSISEDADAIENYNFRNLSAEEVQYRKLQDGIYTYPLNNLTIKAGEVYNTYPIHIHTATLHCDSLYMLPLKLASTSAYELNKEDTVALVKINPVNKYSGLYYVDAVIKNTENTGDSLTYKMPRNAVATGKSMIRLYHYNNEYHTGDANNYRPTHTFTIKVNEDNSLVFATWDQFQMLDGGGVYRPELKLFDFWYTYRENGIIWKTAGYLYKERKTDEEQRIINDWIEEHRK